MTDITERLRSWAQNEEMIDSFFLEHGGDCNEAAEEIEKLRALVADYEVKRQKTLALIRA